MFDVGSDVIDLLVGIPWWGVVVGAVGFLASVVGLFAFGRAVLLAWKGRRKRAALGEFLMEGQAIQRQCADEKSPPPDDEADDWAARIETYLDKNLGTDYVASFRSAAGLPMGMTMIMSQTHRNVQSFLTVRLARLQQFLEELRR